MREVERLQPGSIDAAGDLVFDAANFGTMNINDIVGSGDVTIAAGSDGKFSGSAILADNLSINLGAFTSGSANQTPITLVQVYSNYARCWNWVICVQGTAVAGSTIDGSNYGGATDLTLMSASGTLSVTLGSSGDFSAGQVDAGLLSINA